jgi:hypothetical protein
MYPYPPPPQPVPAGPPTRPGPVTAASVLLYVYAGVALLAALVLAAGGAIGSDYTDIPILGRYAERATFIGFGGAGVLALLAVVDIVLAVQLSRRRGWARIGAVIVSVLVGLVSLTSPLAVLCLPAAGVVVLLLLAPRTTRRYYAG